MTSAVSIKGVSHGFAGSRALAEVSLSIPAGNFTVLLGPSGSGKTTLLSLIGGFLDLQAGTIRIAGQNMAGVPPARRPTATVFQDYALFPHMSIAGNIGFGLRMAGVAQHIRIGRVAEMLALVGLPDIGQRRPHALSGGQKQRVALARALAVSPAVLLLDEPLGALDLKLRRQMQAELVAIQKKVGATFVHVTHDQEEALAIADTIVVMNQGKIADLGTPEEVYLRPRSRFAASFVGQSNHLPGRVAALAGGCAAIDTASGRLHGQDLTGQLRPGGRAVLIARPEHLTLSEAADDALGTAILRSVMFMGAHQVATLSTDDGTEITVQMPQGVPLAAGAVYRIAYQRARAIVLPEEP